MAQPAEVNIATQTIEFVTQNWEWLSTLAGCLVLGAIGLTKTQRARILERDENKCQSKDTRIGCGGRLEVDHILPKEFAEQALKMEPFNCGNLGYNDPPNLLTKCANHHKGHPNSHHPDVHQAQWDYRNGDREAISKAIRAHHELATHGQIYWNNEMDGEDRQIAIERSLEMDDKKGGRASWWPWKR